MNTLNARNLTPPRASRVLLYSHDTFGLGHLRRSRAIASALTAANPGMSALILTGSPVAGRFAFPERVDHIRLPGVIKLHDGSYVSEALGLDIDALTALRAGVIEAAAENFAPDLLIVDKEPTGFRGEMLPTLKRLNRSGTTKTVLGLRDVLDDPLVLADEWDRKNALDAAENYYDQLWVYGLQEIYDPVAGLDFSPELRNRIKWTGYLRRNTGDQIPEESGMPYVLVTPGGGGDGEALVEWVISAYEADRNLIPNARIVYGPFLSGDRRAAFETRVAKLGGRVTTVGFESRMESQMQGALGVVSMGGYNTFCEILSFDKAAAIAPRTVPRLEQYIRAERAEQLGLIQMLHSPRDGVSPKTMAKVIRKLASQKKPSQIAIPGLLGGLSRIVELSDGLMSQQPRPVPAE